MVCLGVPHDYLAQGQVLRQLGAGKYGNVFLFRSNTGELSAVKQMEMYSPENKYNILPPVIRELDMLTKLQGIQEIIQLKGVCFDNKINLILEAEEGDLFDIIETLTNLTDRIQHLPSLVKFLLTTLALFEQANINHYDIKLENILYRKVGDGYQFKLSDFGSARNYFHGEQQNILTYSYSSPEVMSRSKALIPHAGDIWSMGATLFAFITISSYVVSERREEVINEIAYLSGNTYSSIIDGTAKGQIPVDHLMERELGYEFNDVPSGYVDLIQSCMIINPKERPTASQILINICGNVCMPSAQNLQWPDPPRLTTFHREDFYPIVFNVNAINNLPIDTLPMTLELLGRYLQTISAVGGSNSYEQINFKRFFPQFIIVCHHISDVYLNDIELPLENLIDTYKKQSPQLFNVNIDDVIKIRDLFMLRLGFRVYNPHLTNAFDRLLKLMLENPKYLHSLPLSHYLNPVSQWYQ
jgi:serine/threonine protein kinase